MTAGNSRGETGRVFRASYVSFVLRVGLTLGMAAFWWSVWDERGTPSGEAFRYRGAEYPTGVVLVVIGLAVAMGVIYCLIAPIEVGVSPSSIDILRPIGRAHFEASRAVVDVTNVHGLVFAVRRPKARLRVVFRVNSFPRRERDELTEAVRAFRQACHA